MSDSTAPPSAATRVHRPSSAPVPTATSANATTSPIGLANWTRWVSRNETGLMRTEAMSWAWIDDGLWALKKLGLASF